MSELEKKNSKNSNNNSAEKLEEISDSSRRNLLKGAGLIGAAVASAAPSSLIAQQSDSPQSNTKPEESIREALEVLTAREAEVLEAVCDTLIPSDDNGPGAAEARAAHYIDKSLGSHNAEHRNDYFESLIALDNYARGLHHQNFSRLSEALRVDVVTALQNGEVEGCTAGFFSLVRSHTIDGTFCDPYYGGNRDFVGWDLLRYPGVRLSASEADVAAGSDLIASHQSAYDNAAYTKQPMIDSMSSSEESRDD